jgi:hypothetical protein
MSIYNRNALRAKTRTALVDQHGENIAHGKVFKARPRTGSMMYSASTDLVDSQGTYNAGSTRDLNEIIDGLVALRQNGEIHMAAQRQRQADTEELLSQLVEAAYADQDKDSPAFKVLGEVITDEITETMGRMGFTSKVLAFKNVPEGQVAQIKIKRKDVLGWQVLDDGEVIESFVVPTFYQPKFYYLASKIKFEEGSVHEWGASLVEEKHNDGVEAIMVRDDNITRSLLDAAAPVLNDVVAFNALTPNVFSELMTQVGRWSIPVPHALISIDLWNDLRADQDWQKFWSPIEKHTLAEDGILGGVMGVELVTDGFQYDTLKVLQPGEIYMVGAPAALGIKCERIPLTSKPLEFHLLGDLARGWMLYCYQSSAVLNSRGVAKGTKV